MRNENSQFLHKRLNTFCLIYRDIRCKDDVYTHVYTLIVEPDQTYEVLIDGEKVQSGTFDDDWSFLEPKKVNFILSWNSTWIQQNTS